MKLGDGLIILDKEVGISSFQAIACLRRALGIRKTGHAGTLDPFASGALPTAFGRWTSALFFMEENRKRYTFRALLGERRDTQDREGELLQSVPQEIIRSQMLSGELEERLQRVLPEMVGDILQTPPMYSAIKIQGRPLYRYAREGREVERQERKVNTRIESLRFLQEGETCWMEGCLDVSKGTYIRSWVDTLGEKLGVLACCQELRRLSCGPFEVVNGLPSGQIQERFEACGKDCEVFRQQLQDDGYLRSLREAWPDLPRLSLSAGEARDMIDGKGLDVSEALALRIEGGGPEEDKRLYLEREGRPLAMARFRREDNGSLCIKSERVWLQHGDLS